MKVRPRVMFSLLGSVLFFAGSVLLGTQQVSPVGHVICYIYASGSVLFFIGTLSSR